MLMKNKCGIVLGLAIGVAVSLPAHAAAEQVCEQTAAKDSSASASQPVAARAGNESSARRIFRDPLLKNDWEILEDCAHPERPPRMVQIAGATVRSSPVSPLPEDRVVAPFARKAEVPVSRTTATKTEARLRPVAPPDFGHSALRSTVVRPVASNAPSPLFVRAGDHVRLWSAGADVRLEIQAVALEYGRAGQVIHLRRLGSTAGPRTILTGVVDGRGSAELLP